MNREIKFRGWKISSKEMFNVQCLSDEDIYSFFDAYDRCNCDSHPKNECLLMQFTRLLDKNGVEIYEGDICTYHSPENPACVTWFTGQDSSYGINPGYYLRWPNGSWIELGDDANHEHCEVIGNIHQNPELLK